METSPASTSTCRRGGRDLADVQPHSAFGAQIRNLRLSSQTITRIFTGDHQLVGLADQARLRRPLPNLPIKIVVRSDGSGTSAQFTAYIDAAAADPLALVLSACTSIGAAVHLVLPLRPAGCLLNAIAQRGSRRHRQLRREPRAGCRRDRLRRGRVRGRPPLPHRRGQEPERAIHVYRHRPNVAIALPHVTLNPDSTEDLSRGVRSPRALRVPDVVVLLLDRADRCQHLDREGERARTVHHLLRVRRPAGGGEVGVFPDAQAARPVRLRC